MSEKDTTTIPVTLASGAALSATVTLPFGYYLAAILMPAAWTAADLTFQAGPTPASVADLHNEAGTEITASAAASRCIALAEDTWRALPAVKIRSGTSATPVNQTAERTLTLVCRRA